MFCSIISLRPRDQVVSRVKIDEADQQRQPAAVGNLGQVGGEIGTIERYRQRQQRATAPAQCFQRHSLNSTTVSSTLSINIAPVTAMP
jgi:hypothetical protein